MAYRTSSKAQTGEISVTVNGRRCDYQTVSDAMKAVLRRTAYATRRDRRYPEVSVRIADGRCHQR